MTLGLRALIGSGAVELDGWETSQGQRDDAGNLLASINAVGGGHDETDGKIMTYSWRISMTNDPATFTPSVPQG